MAEAQAVVQVPRPPTPKARLPTKEPRTSEPQQQEQLLLRAPPTSDLPRPKQPLVPSQSPKLQPTALLARPKRRVTPLLASWKRSARWVGNQREWYQTQIQTPPKLIRLQRRTPRVPSLTYPLTMRKKEPNLPAMTSLEILLTQVLSWPLRCPGCLPRRRNRHPSRQDLRLPLDLRWSLPCRCSR